MVLDHLKPDKVAVLVDENTRLHCLPKLDTTFDLTIEIKSGEINKNLGTCSLIWERLTEARFTRKSLLVNLGGGVIGDMGGFCAATYKRGIPFINVPTTLLAAVDANIGGKLGIDFNGYKNHIGLFQNPEVVIISETFLETLPSRELRSGFAEVIKHALIYDNHYWEQISGQSYPDMNWTNVISRSVEIKGDVVDNDPKENGLRKILNFGHTIGHAIESYYLTNGLSLLHGEAIATGMILESKFANELGLLEENDLLEITKYITSIYQLVDLPDQKEVYNSMLQDKKNRGSVPSFSLINSIGSCLYDQQVSKEMISKGYNFYKNLK